MRAAVGGDQPDDHVEARGLAGAVRAEQPDDFAARDVERHVVHDRARLVALLQARRRQLAHFAGARSPDGVQRQWRGGFRGRALVLRGGRPCGGGVPCPSRAAPCRAAGRRSWAGTCRARGRCGRRSPGAGGLASGGPSAGRARSPSCRRCSCCGSRRRRVFRIALSKSSSCSLLAVVLDALRPALVVAVGVVALLRGSEIGLPIGRRRQRVVGVLLEVDAVGLDRQRALRDDDVAGEHAGLASRS